MRRIPESKTTQLRPTVGTHPNAGRQGREAPTKEGNLDARLPGTRLSSTGAEPPWPERADKATHGHNGQLRPALPSHSSTSAVNSEPPATGSHHPGRPFDCTTITLAVNAPKKKQPRSEWSSRRGSPPWKQSAHRP